MFYSYFYSQAGMRPAYGTSITFSGAQSTVRCSTSVTNATTNANATTRYPAVLFIYGVFYPVHQITPYGSSFLTIPYGTVFNL